MSLPSDNVLKVPSRNVLLTRSPWRGEQPRTTTDDTTRARPAGGAEQSRQEADHPKAGRPANRPQRTASEAAAGEAPQPRRPGRNPCGARPRLQPQDQRQGGKASRRDSLQTALRRLWADPGGGVSAAAPRHPRRPGCGNPAGASRDERTCGVRGGVAAASWCNGTPPSTTGWKDAARSCT